jgi:hypothetical protein
VIPRATDKAATAPGIIPLPAPVYSEGDGPVGVEVASAPGVVIASAVGVATAIMVCSSTGVDVYSIGLGKSAKAMLEKGRLATEVAPGKASRSGAGADGCKEARSNSPGANTLGRC